MPLRVGFHSSSLPCLVGALLMDLSISSVVVGLGTLSQSSISDSLRSWGSLVSVHSRSGMSGEVGAGGGGVLELLFFLLITTLLNIIFGFLVTDLLNS